jgi:deazaflavin-dependent oxidoreductase (nitroreductase family)
MNGNDFVALMLRSPLHRLMGPTVLITVTGRKSGRPITTPVNYVAEGSTLWILTSRSRKWWRNIGADSCVRVLRNGREQSGLAALVSDGPAVAARLADYVRRMPSSARPLGIKIENGCPNDIDVARAASERLFVKVCLA